MLIWHQYFTPDRTSLLDKKFEREHAQLVLRSPFANKSFDVDTEFDECLKCLSLTRCEEGQNEMESKQRVIHEHDERTEREKVREGEHEELPYDETTSTELLIRKWRACSEGGRVYFYHRWDDQGIEDNASRIRDGNHQMVIRVHLHRAKCKAKALVRAMQETRRMALPRNFRRIYFGSKHLREKGMCKMRSSMIGNKA
jgi:hypothetical protein